MYMYMYMYMHATFNMNCIRVLDKNTKTLILCTLQGFFQISKCYFGGVELEWGTQLQIYYGPFQGVNANLVGGRVNCPPYPPQQKCCVIFHIHNHIRVFTKLISKYMYVYVLLYIMYTCTRTCIIISLSYLRLTDVCSLPVSRYSEEFITSTVLGNDLVIRWIKYMYMYISIFYSFSCELWCSIQMIVHVLTGP